MANSFTLGGALGSALTSAKGMVKNISSPQNQTLNNIKTGVVSAVKNAPANIGSAVNTANNVYKAVTNPVGTTAGLINKATTPAPKPAVNTVQNTPGVLPQKSTKPVDNFNYNADAGQTTGVVKSTTNVGADGSKQTTTYHPPTETKSTGTDKQGNNLPTTGGVATPQGEPKYKPETQNVYGQMTTDLANRYTKPIENYDQIQAKLADNAAKQAALEREIVAREANIGTSGVDLSLATGERGILSSKAQAGLSSLRNEGSQLASMLGAANTQQGLQQSALQQSATLAAPKSVSPSDTLVSPTNMQPQYGLGSDGDGSNPYQKWATLQYNTNTGLEAGGKATQIDIPMRSIDNLVPKLTDFMTKSGINPTSSTWYNDLISNYAKGAGDPAGMIAYEGMVNELQTYTRQILGASSGLITPTAADDIIKKLSIENLSPVNIKEVVATVHQMGEIQKNTLQTTQTELMQSGTSPYAGRPAEVSSGFETTTRPATSVINPTKDVGYQAGLAGAIGIIPATLGALTGWAKGLFTK